MKTFKSWIDQDLASGADSCAPLMLPAFAMMFALLIFVSVPAHEVAAGGLKVLKKEPPAGHLKSEERVLVDDGSCPTGQIKLVIGGSNRVYKTNTVIPGKPRRRRCIQR